MLDLRDLVVIGNANYSELVPYREKIYSNARTLFLDSENRLTQQFSQMLNGELSVTEYLEMVQSDMGLTYIRRVADSYSSDLELIKRFHQRGGVVERILNRQLFDGMLSSSETRVLDRMRKYHDESNEAYRHAMQAQPPSFEEVTTKIISYAIASTSYFSNHFTQYIAWIRENIGNYESPVVFRISKSWVSVAELLRKELFHSYDTRLIILEQIASYGYSSDPRRYAFPPLTRLRHKLLDDLLGSDAEPMFDVEWRQNTNLDFELIRLLAAQSAVHLDLINSKQDEEKLSKPQILETAANLVFRIKTLSTLGTAYHGLYGLRDHSFEEKFDFLESVAQTGG